MCRDNFEIDSIIHLYKKIKTKELLTDRFQETDRKIFD